jgi:hypothetical protein
MPSKSCKVTVDLGGAPRALVELRSGGAAERKAIIREIERFMNVETPNGKPLTDAERQATNAKLITHLQMQRLKRLAFGWAKKQGSALGKIVLHGAFKGALKAHGM